MPATAVLFPGQGSLTPDAGAVARSLCPDLVERATELVGADPFEHAAESTAFAQPAIFIASIAGWSARAADVDELVAMAGHSLGELSALAAAGAITVDDGLRLVVLRGRLMADAAASAARDGGMIALLGGETEAAARLAHEHGLVVANDNAPGQVVLSGPRVAFDDLRSVARAEGFKALPLDVAGAFHSPAVAAAREPFLAALRAVEWAVPVVPVVSGLTAEPFRDAPGELAAALTAPVRWREVMASLYRLGARDFVDAGPGHVLERLVPRNPHDLEKRAPALAR